MRVLWLIELESKIMGKKLREPYHVYSSCTFNNVKTNTDYNLEMLMLLTDSHQVVKQAG